MDRNDPYYIPKTTEKNGVTLSLADVDWTPMASAADDSEVPSLFRATALYTGTAWGSKADGYTVTADYTGEVSKTAPGKVMYSIIYEEVSVNNIAFPWKTVVLAVACVVLAAGGAFAVFRLLYIPLRKKRRPAVSQKSGSQNEKSMEAAL